MGSTMRHGTAFGLGRTACDATPVVAIGSKTAGCSYSGFAGWQCSHELALRRKGRSGKDFERRVPDCLLFKALSKKLQFGSSLSTLDRDLKLRGSAVKSTETLSAEENEEIGVFEGLGGPETPVGVCETKTLAASLTLKDAIAKLEFTMRAHLNSDAPPVRSGVIRIQVPLPPDVKALDWLRSQPLDPQLLPRSYFSSREPRGDGSSEFADLDKNIVRSGAGIGSAVLFKGQKPFTLQDWKTLRRFVSPESPLVRAYGGLRFNSDTDPSTEWKDFGSFYFFIPQVEFSECETCSLLAVTVAWDVSMGWTFQRAANSALSALHKAIPDVVAESGGLPSMVKKKEHVPNERSWHEAVNKVVAVLEANDVKDVGDVRSSMERKLEYPLKLGKTSLSKVVMARRTRLDIGTTFDPLTLLATLQEKDPSAYQFAIQIPDGTAFVGSTPERLFVRRGLLVSSEAVAATRARGKTEAKDLQKAMDLLLSQKDHKEFEIVRESVKRHLEMVCSNVDVESHKETIKQARVQHLYSRLNGELRIESGEYDLLSLLHPTPAVCGHPQAVARRHIASTEEFDRGMYAGPIGWIGGDGAEFCVGIRSALVKPPCETQLLEKSRLRETPDRNENGSASISELAEQISPSSGKATVVYLYAGVGVVKDSKAESEWQELELKVSQFETLFKPALPLQKEININYLWSKLIVEECCRLGVTYFCIAPGSRSSPLTAAAAANPRATCVTCIDERSLAFHALGYGKGANKPAAIITSSGTAVSNLLPAVVEACQDFVPMLLLTADRPSEMHDAGANQTIDQGKHFGGFVRYHVNLPPPADSIPARFVLTTVDTAVFRATTVPVGAVHINCQFREPLAGTQEAWNPECLKGLEGWVYSSSPFTKYMTSNPGLFAGGFPSLNADLKAVAAILQGAKRGLIIAGGLQVAAETWAVALLAHHLGWPVVPDVVSGLRLGRTPHVGDESSKELVVVHNFDHVLLSNSVYDSVTPDVVLQIGGRLTSKRLSNFLEQCYPRAYILVEDHNFRQDPSHILTCRIQCPAVEFSSMMQAVLPPGKVTRYAHWLLELSNVCGQEITSRLLSEVSLREPQIARLVAASLPLGASLFLGNSMAIRDVDMYGQAISLHPETETVPDFGVRVAANRGASGIDGVLSSATGFAVGSNRRVTLLLGDVSFLHDTNGLSFLKSRSGQPPITVIVVNNSGGGIFSLLPIAKTVPSSTFEEFWETSHNVGLGKLCLAHSVRHLLVKSRKDLNAALQLVQKSRLSWVVEVLSSINENTIFHRWLTSSVLREVNRAYGVLCRFKSEFATKILDLEIHGYSFPLGAPPTTQVNRDNLIRKGFVIRLTLSNGAHGIGEVAPLPGLHGESLLDVEEQLRLVASAMKGIIVVRTLPLLNGHISAWLTNVVGIDPEALHASVRCGLEMAILDALAQSLGCSIFELLVGTRKPAENESRETTKVSEGVRICGLLDGEGTVEDIATTAYQYVLEGYCTLKVKVGRRKDPVEDAAVVKAIRDRIGPDIVLRADANRRWTYDQAVQFANYVRSCDLQYLEEPLQNVKEISKFCMDTGLPVALDETIDEMGPDCVQQLSKYRVDGVVAMVIKPGRVGGFERATSLARLGQVQGIVTVISAAFESSISLAAYAQFSAYLDARRFEAEAEQDIHIDSNASSTANLTGVIAHGLGTFDWLPGNANDLFTRKFHVKYTSSGVLSPISNGPAAVELYSSGQELGSSNWSTYVRSVNRGSTTYNFAVVDTAPNSSNVTVEKRATLFFLHGFLGRGNDWVPIMNALAISFRCIAVDLIGHGDTSVDETAPDEGCWSMDSLAGSLSDLLLSIHAHNVVLVGYSMGGRIALYQAMRYNQEVVAAIIVSGSPGLHDSSSQVLRAAQDDELAQSMLERGIEDFVDLWYRKPLWESMRGRPDFQAIKQKRKEQKDVKALAKSLRSLSIGRQESLWKALGNCPVPLLCVAGQLDSKFSKIAHQMRDAQQKGSSSAVEDTSSAEPEVESEELLEDEYGFVAWLARNAKNLDKYITPPPGVGAKVDKRFQKLDKALHVQLREFISTERLKAGASLGESIRSRNFHDNRGLSELASQDLENWDNDENDENFESEEGTIRSTVDSAAASGDAPLGQSVPERPSGVSILEVAGCGHSVHLESPLVFVRELRRFVHSVVDGTDG